MRVTAHRKFLCAFFLLWKRMDIHIKDKYTWRVTVIMKGEPYE